MIVDFLLGERTGLEQDRIGDRDLAHVVQRRGEFDQPGFFLGQPRPSAMSPATCAMRSR